jgi:hypothetical protein
MLYATGRRWCRRYSAYGQLYFAKVRPMPRINDEALGCVLYLYRSVEEAHDGAREGATGFLVGVQSERHAERIFLYAVTNAHVLNEGALVLRLNTKDGGVAVHKTEAADWVVHPDRDDVAVCSLAMFADLFEQYRYTCIPAEHFLTRQLAAELDIGPGNEVCVIGRFPIHGGVERNLPTVRFGTIAMMPDPATPIRQRRRHHDQESFLVEMRSLGGASGSPVVAYGLGWAYNQDWDFDPLLGIIWGHLDNFELVYHEDGETPVEGYVVRSNSGMAGVVPAWKLQELLDVQELARERREEDRRLQRRKDRDPASLDVARGERRPDTSDQLDEERS